MAVTGSDVFVACYRPVSGYRDHESGSVSIGYHAGQQGYRLELPCGHCVGCKLDRGRAWQIRIGHEAQLYDSNLFVTLDYAPEHLPESRSLEYPHFQKFMKRLRKALPTRVRFFCSGEYGEQNGRPHWHAILFNTHFPDSVRYVNGTLRSAMAEDLWGYGRVVIGDVTPQSAAYVAGYTLNKVYGRVAAEEHYEDVVNLSTGELTSRRPEFCTMSRRPGIGALWYERYRGDILPNDFAVSGDGRKCKVPGYYWRKFQVDGDPDLVEEIHEERYRRAKEVDPAESTEARRAVREQVAEARVRLYSPRHI